MTEERDSGVGHGDSVDHDRLAQQIAAVRQDQEFQRRLASLIEQNREILERLS